MWTRIVWLLTAVALSGGILCGCGSDEDVGEAPSKAASVAQAAESGGAESRPIETFAEALTELEPPSASTPASAGEVAKLSDEIQGLRVEVGKLEETLEVYLDVVLSDLKEENARLRQEIVRLYQRQGMMEAEDRVPRPGRSFLERIVEETPYDAEMSEAAFLARFEAPAEPEPLAPVDEAFNGEPFAVVKEWGRGPEEVAALGRDISTLRGMICAVPEGIAEDELVQLARGLHAQYADYDNINIEFFEGMEAAKHYAETNKADAERRVLSISKHRVSGRDVILLMTQGVTREIAVSE